MQAVRRGNETVVKLTIKGLICHHINVLSITEQPVSSLMNYVPFYKRMLKVCGTSVVCTYLGQFGAVSCKPIKLFHNQPWAARLRRPKPRGLVRLSRRGMGKRVTGLCKLLSASQVYPVAFGKAVADLL